MVELPMINIPDGFKDTGVPDTVAALPPGVIVVPAIAKPDGFTVKA